MAGARLEQNERQGEGWRPGYPRIAALLTPADISIRFTGDFLGDRGQRVGFLVLAAFLLSWIFIRTSARLIRSPKVPWWPGSVTTSGGLHIHHLVWGICLLITSGFVAFAIQPGSPWLEVLGVLFGIGIGLTLDEFALWLYLDDVYWTQKGRQSIDAVVFAAVLGGLVVAGVAPFDLGDGPSILAIGGAILWVVAWCAIGVLKGKPLMAAIGVFVPAVAQVAAIRLAVPESPWARWFYDADGRKLERAAARSERSGARRLRWSDRIGGAPSSQPEKPPS
jgi:hypothetical protein